MSRSLIITDCDEVLLHMISPFRDWLGEAKEIDFDLTRHEFHKAMRRKADGELIEVEEVWQLLGQFFDTEMPRQYPIEGAVQSIHALQDKADVVVLTNLQDHRQADRMQQLAGHGLDLKVYTNQGPKGPAVQRILDEYQPARAIFIDDLAQHHDSVASTVPQVTRLHLCGEPAIAPHVACAHAAGHAHARIDRWDQALPWLLERI